MTSFEQQQQLQPKDCLLPGRQEQRREAVVLNLSKEEETGFNGDGGGGGGSGGGGGGGGGDGIGGRRGRGNISFLDRLRAQLLRVRVARLLRQDFALGKQLAELKALCDEVSTELGTHVSQELWNVVSRQGRASDPHGTVQGSSVTTASAAHLGQLQKSSLAQDAGLVSLARALLRRAAGVANNRPVRNGRSSHEWHSNRPLPPSPPTSCNPWKGPSVLPPSYSSRGNNEGGGQTPAELSRHDIESRDDPLIRKSEDNLTVTTRLPPAPPSAPLPTPPLTPSAPVATTTASIRSLPDAPRLLASKGGASNTMNACFNSVLAGKGAPAAAAMVGAAKNTRFVQTGDRASAVDGTATRPRNEGGPSLQPKSHVNTLPSSSKRVDFHCHNGKDGALVLEEEPPRPPAGDDIGPRDETRVGDGGFSVTLSARGAQTVTVCLSQCPCRRFDGKQAVDTTAAAAVAAAASACSIRHAVDGSRGLIDGDIDRALSSKLFTRPAESKDKRPSTLYRSEEEVHHQELRRVPPVYPRPQISTHFCQAPSPRPPPSPQALPVAGIACSPQKNKSFGENPRGKIGSRQKPHPARSYTFGTEAKTTCEDVRNVAPPISVLGPMGSYTDDPRGGGRLSYDDSRVCVQPSSVNFLARQNVCSPRIESDGGDAGRCPCCHRLGDGYQNEQHITGAKQWQPEKADSSHTASPSGTTTTQEAAEHPAGYRRRYGRRDDSEKTRQRYASGGNKNERQPLQSADSNTDRINKEASPTRRRLPSAGSMESDAETAGMAEAREDDSSSCALARKRALVRVRLTRQRKNLAAAVSDANERGFRAERRRRREERLAALLLKTFGGGAVDGSRHIERRPLSFQDDKNDSEGGGSESGSSLTGVRGSRTHQKEIKRPQNGAASAVPSVSWHSYQDTPPPPDGGGTPSPSDGGGTAPPPGDGGGLRRNRPGSGNLRLPISPIVVVEKGREEEEEAEVPRQPLKIIPVKSELPACRFRSAWCADNNERRLRGNTPGTSTQHAEAPHDVDSHSPRERRFTRIMSSSSPLVVFIDALRALPRRCSYFDGGVGWDGTDGGRPSIWDEPCVAGAGGVFLVLEAGRLEHQTAVRLPAHAGTDFCRATTGREQEGEGGGNAWVADGRRRKIADRKVMDDRWIFRETVVLQPTATVIGDELALVENGLRVRVYAIDKRLAYDDGSGVEVEKDHRLVGVATLPLRRLAMGGVLGDDSSKQACECTFSRPVEVSVSSVEGVAIGWLGLSICGGVWGVLGGDYNGA